MGVANRCSTGEQRETSTLVLHTMEYTMGDWGIEVGDLLRFEYSKAPGKEVYTLREGVVEKVAGWGVVLAQSDDGEGTLYKSYSVYDPHKCRNLVRIPANTPMCGDGI